jgi:hypothetical protein
MGVGVSGVPDINMDITDEQASVVHTTTTNISKDLDSVVEEKNKD